MSVELGLDARLYRNTAAYASPTWNEVKNVKDLTLSLEAGEADTNAPDRLRRAQQDLSGMDDLLSQIDQDKVSVKGTFNALGARGLGSEGPAKATAKNTKRILQEAQHGGLTFGSFEE